MSLPRVILRLLYGGRSPVTDGELTVPGPARPVVVRRDGWGVPHVQAESPADALFGLGFAQGQDRSFQLELLVRLVRGTLAELVGPDALPADRMSRRVGFRRAAEQTLPALDADIRGWATAFAAGINAGRTAGSTAPPHELALLGGDLTAWDAVDVLGFVKLQSFLLPSNYDVELARLAVLRSDGPDAVRDLDPLPADWLPTIMGEPGDPTAGSPLEQLSADLAAFARFAPPGGGSNNWAAAGSRTASGRPLLASDPHLGATVPSPWYLAHVVCPEWQIAGAAFAGSPVFPIGFNGTAAWGVTAGLTDNSDLFLETVGPDGRSVRQPDGTFAACEVARETIRVKGEADVIEEVLVTPRGPVISPLVDGLSEAVSLRAVWLDPLPVRGFFDSPAAADWEGFRRPFAAWPGLPLNVVYADRHGTIGYQLIGQLPVRASGFGTLPLPADAPNVGWAELLPFEQMPHRSNPPEGFLATANNPQWPLPNTMSGRAGGVNPLIPPSPATSPNGNERYPGSEDQGANAPRSPDPFPFLGLDTVDGYRAAVISDALAARSDWSVPGFQKLQTDERCRPWEEMRDFLLSLAPADSDATAGLNELRSWDGRASADSPAAAVFELFLAEMSARVAKARAPKGWATTLGGTGKGPLGHNLFADRRVAHLSRLLRDRPPGWFPDGWELAASDAVAAAVRTLKAKAGPSPSYWGWGHLRTLTAKHPIMGGVRLAGRAFNLGPIPAGGDTNTVNQAGVRPLDPTGNPVNVPNLRAVIDPGDFAASRFALLGGQSGNPCSPHYADQFEKWQAGDGIPIPWTPDEVLRAAVSAVRLVSG